MELLNQYFNDLVFTRIDVKRGFTLYGAALHSQLAGDKQRHILAFVPVHLSLWSSAKLSQLQWVNLQMRMCNKTTYRLKPQVWIFPSSLPNLFFNVHNRAKTYSSYKVDGGQFPFEMLLINSPKKESIYQYPNVVNLHWAIDQFNTVFNYVGTNENFDLL
jgi:hypothetical protein